MKDLKCIVYDEDRFTKELILSFIEMTEGISSVSKTQINEADILFVDAALFDGDYMIGLKSNAKVVIISSSKQFIHSFFKNKIADYFDKSEISYHRFLVSLEKVKAANLNGKNAERP